jgi:hypothetical protein
MKMTFMVKDCKARLEDGLHLMYGNLLEKMGHPHYWMLSIADYQIDGYRKVPIYAKRRIIWDSCTKYPLICLTMFQRYYGHTKPIPKFLWINSWSAFG